MSNRSRNERASARAGSRKEPQPQLTDEQWKLIADLFPDPAPSAQGGRPRRAARECVEGILWVLCSGARWKDLPSHFPSLPTCWRRSRIGPRLASGQRPGRDCCACSIAKAASSGKRGSPTERSPRRKKGAERRQDEVRQGNQDDGSHRRSRPAPGGRNRQRRSP